MGKPSRDKGRRFEQRIATDLRVAFPAAIVRRSSQAYGAYEPDVVVEGEAPLMVRRLWLELTDGAHPDPGVKLAQAERDSERASPGAWLPVVVWHRTGERTTWATLRLGTLCEIARATCEPGDWAGAVVTLDWAELLRRLVGPEPDSVPTVTGESYYGVDRSSSGTRR